MLLAVDEAHEDVLKILADKTVIDHGEIDSAARRVTARCTSPLALGSMRIR